MRHLIYHIWPLDTPAGRQALRWHLRQLQAQASLFDGQKIFAIVTGAGLADPGSVKELLPPEAQVLVRPNDRVFGESCTLPMLLARAFTLAPSDTIFYAHTKGLSHLGTAFESPTRWWSLSMYRWLLSAPALDLLQSHPFVGWLKYQGPHGMFPPWSTWHYAGNFWWFRAADIYRRAWWNIVPTHFGAEAYPSGLVTNEEAACLYARPWTELQRPDGLGAMYFFEFWREFGIPMGPGGDKYE